MKIVSIVRELVIENDELRQLLKLGDDEKLIDASARDDGRERTLVLKVGNKPQPMIKKGGGYA